MWEPFELILKKFRELETQLADPAIAGDRVRYARVAKEHGGLLKQIKPYLEFNKVSEDLSAVEEMMAAEADADARKYYEEEQSKLTAQKITLQDRSKSCC